MKYKVISIDDYGVVVEDVEKAPKRIGEHILYKGKVEKVEGVYTYLGYKVIATIGKRIEGLPLIELPEQDNEVFKLAADHVAKFNVPSVKSAEKFYISGYKAAQSKGTYTEEDMVALIVWLKERLQYNQNTGKFHVDVEGTGEQSDQKVSSSSIVKQFLQSLQNKKIPIEVELETDYEFLPLSTPKYPKTKTILKITNKETNTITPINVIYS